MAWIFLRHKVFYNQLKRLHTSVVCNTPTFNFLNEKKAFEAVWPEVIDCLMTRSKLTPQPEVGSWVKQLLEYTLSGGSPNRGLCLTIGYRMMEDPSNLTEETLHSARILGWCLEMLHVHLLVLDDMIDGSTTRRGKLCWYHQPNVGPAAINDALLIYQCMVEVLEINFGKTPLIAEIMKLINEAVLYTSMGEYFDCSSTYKKHKNNISVFTMERFETIATYKTSFSFFKLPVFSALLLIKNGQDKATKELSDICLTFGRFYQLQNDYMDVYGDETITGKAGTDIQEGKCSWVAVTALQHCNESQRSLFKEYYGSKDPEHVKRIKQLYDELHLPVLYEKYVRIVYDDLLRRIHALPTDGETKLFTELLNYIHEPAY